MCWIMYLAERQSFKFHTYHQSFASCQIFIFRTISQLRTLQVDKQWGGGGGRNLNKPNYFFISLSPSRWQTHSSRLEPSLRQRWGSRWGLSCFFVLCQATLTSSSSRTSLRSEKKLQSVQTGVHYLMGSWSGGIDSSNYPKCYRKEVTIHLRLEVGDSKGLK